MQATIHDCTVCLSNHESVAARITSPFCLLAILGTLPTFPFSLLVVHTEPLTPFLSLQQYRYTGVTLAQAVLAPFIFSLLLFILQQADYANQRKSNAHPTYASLPGVKPCQGRNPGDPCVSILYTPAGVVNGIDYTKIMQTFADKNQQRTGYQFKLEPAFTDPTAAPSRIFDIVPVPDDKFIYKYAVYNPNVTSWGIAFTQPTAASPINVRYQLWTNSTATTNSTKLTLDVFSRDVLSMVRGIDEAIITVLNDPTATVKADVDVGLKDWPLAPPSILSDSIVQFFGPTFFFSSVMIVFINVISQIVSEKELRQRHGMEVMGLRPTIYWLSHFISTTVVVLFNSLFTVIFGLIFNFQVFKNSSFGVTFLTFFIFGESMLILAFFITTLTRQVRTAVLVGIFLFVIGMIFETFLFSNAYVGFIWWSTLVPKFVASLFSLLPFFNFGLIFLQISTLTTGSIDQLTGTFIPGPGFPWSALYNQLPKTLLTAYGSKGYPDVPTPVKSWIWMIIDAFLFGLLLWFFDNVIPNEFGASYPPWFFVLPSYWGFENSNAADLRAWQKTQTTGKSAIKIEGDEDSDVIAARERALDPDYFPPLKIVNLRKVYRHSFLQSSPFDKIAVRNSCFTVEEGKLLALLGQNGAGKSTTISMLSGLTPPTSGDALIYNLSAKYQTQSIRKIMGICPQHDILFDDLTAREHIQLYAGLKGIPHDQIKALIEERLEAVRLRTVADVRAGTYSGGMKRRLSLVISTIGDPKIIFMDEPTTGMDPVNRRHVWSFIEKFKQGRVIILTTHSMEEADVLGDEIAVMSKGRLRAINNSTALKSKFGEGYHISVVCNASDSPKVKEHVTRLVPNAVLEDDSAGALSYQLSSSAVHTIPNFVRWLENNNQSGLIKSWGISQSTLEEVFLKLIREANQKFK
eukprot:jgi/Hompol1/1508/HPOL_000597-RA